MTDESGDEDGCGVELVLERKRLLVSLLTPSALRSSLPLSRSLPKPLLLNYPVSAYTQDTRDSKQSNTEQLPDEVFDSYYTSCSLLLTERNAVSKRSQPITTSTLICTTDLRSVSAVAVPVSGHV